MTGLRSGQPFDFALLRGRILVVFSSSFLRMTYRGEDIVERMFGGWHVGKEVFAKVCEGGENLFPQFDVRRSLSNLPVACGNVR